MKEVVYYSMLIVTGQLKQYIYPQIFSALNLFFVFLLYFTIQFYY